MREWEKLDHKISNFRNPDFQNLGRNPIGKLLLNYNEVENSKAKKTNLKNQK